MWNALMRDLKSSNLSAELSLSALILLLLKWCMLHAVWLIFKLVYVYNA